jgi:Uri superfamily endonuclease
MSLADFRDRFHTDFANAGLSGVWVMPAGIADAPPVHGAYIVCLQLAVDVEINLPRLPSSRLAPGWYVYVGSAWGSGGIRSRLKRHFKRAKSVHWHIDRLTVNTDRIAALALVDCSECDLVDKLLRSNRFTVAMAGFGNSDCRQCESHLLGCDPL